MSAYGPVVDIKVMRETVSHHQVYEKRVFWWNRQCRQVGIVVTISVTASWDFRSARTVATGALSNLKRDPRRLP